MKYTSIRTWIVALAVALLCLFGTDEGAEASNWQILRQQPRSALNGLRLSELMPCNVATIASDDGRFSEWLELYNAGDQAVELNRVRIRCGKKSWVVPGGRLEPGEYTVIFCNKLKPAVGIQLRNDFTLAKSGENLVLYTTDGVLLDAVKLPELGENMSYARVGSSWQVTRWASPGEANTEDGHRAFQQTLTVPAEGLVIGEVMIYNEWYLPHENVYYDWVELTNYGTKAVRLSNYYLSDRDSNRLLFTLPNETLEPGESFVVLCSPDSPEPGFAPFALDSAGEALYLSKRNGALCDYVSLREIPLGCSYGRMRGEGGFFFFAAPSPGEENRDGVRFTGVKPENLVPDGVFEGVESLSVPIHGLGFVRYTLDGSVPTETSQLYQAPIEVTETTVIRAVSFLDDHLPSEPLDLSFILNEGHSLPVVSVVCDPDALFNPVEGIYSNPLLEDEKTGSVAYFGEDGQFRLACGVKLHGATSRLEMAKKSFKLSFRDRYEGRLQYDLFHNGVTEFASVLLRADQEGGQSTCLRDNLMHQLARSAFPKLPAQDSRFAVLYLNGAYWGMYTIREAHSETHFARHYGYEESLVTQWKGAWDPDSVIQDVFSFAQSHDLANEKDYAYVTSYLDTDSIIAWCIIQAYSGNFDFNSPNMRFYYSAEDETLHYALVDLDLSFFSYGNFAHVLAYGYDYNLMVMYMLKNEGFCRDFLQQMSAALKGPLSDETVLERLRELETEIAPEMERDSRRWDGTYEAWEAEVQVIRNFITMNKGRAENVIQLLRESGMIDPLLIDEYFPA